MISFVRWLTVYVGYWIRPYDMLADQRRWFWQRRTPCGGVIFIDSSKLQNQAEGKQQ
jgi:hypothetical protein